MVRKSFQDNNKHKINSMKNYLLLEEGPKSYDAAQK